jgi:hypothetical protein
VNTESAQLPADGFADLHLSPACRNGLPELCTDDACEGPAHLPERDCDERWAAVQESWTALDEQLPPDNPHSAEGRHP